MESVEVTGSRVRGLAEGATAQPMLTLTGTDIDRTGAQSISDVLRYIPQVSAFTTGQGNTQATVTTLINTQTGATTLGAAAGAIDATAGRVTATIRGAPAGATLLLIDGKRVPRNSQARSGDGYDLNGIPLAAVERIEVLLDGASSVYGADAMGGVINVILKKNYRGTEVRLGYENSFDTDSGVRTASLSLRFLRRQTPRSCHRFLRSTPIRSPSVTGPSPRVTTGVPMVARIIATPPPRWCRPREPHRHCRVAGSDHDAGRHSLRHAGH